MRRQTVSVSSQAASAAIPVDHTNPANISFAVTFTTAGTLTYTVQHTLDDIYDSSVTKVWFDHSAVAGETTNQDGNYAYPIAAIRLNVTAYTDGVVKLTVLQGT